MLDSGAVVVVGDGVLLGVASWAAGSGHEGGPVLEEAELEDKFEVSGGDERGLWGG